MAERFTSIRAFLDAPFDTVIDARSPAEFAEDHVPGALSLPVLDDAERARVGTIYKQQSPFAARKIGAALVARNAAAHIEGPLAGMGGGWRPLVYCWRGGQRSNAFAGILGQIGWRAGVVEGGYKSWRRLVTAQLHDLALPHRVVLLDGNTGTAKTDMLARLARRDVQVIDLEGRANHRGSVFGARGEQPAQKGFESALAVDLATLDPARPTVIEAESSRIGAVSVPPALWAAMCEAPRLTLSAPVAARARFLQRSYGDIAADLDRLDAMLGGLVRLQGRARVEAWRALAREGAHDALAAELITHHYDPRYARQRSRHAVEPLARIDLGAMTEGDLERAADRIAERIAVL